MIANIIGMQTATVICTMTQSTLRVATLTAYSQTLINTSTHSSICEGFYHHQSQKTSACTHSHYYLYYFKYEISFYSLLIVH